VGFGSMLSILLATMYMIQPFPNFSEN